MPGSERLRGADLDLSGVFRDLRSVLRLSKLLTKQNAPAALRNRGPILEVLREILPASGSGTVLEIAGGTGQHAVFFAAALPHLGWQPSDPEALAQGSIEAYRREAGLPNLLPPVEIDVLRPVAEWPVQQAIAILCINMIHIAPWAACKGLFTAAREILASGQPLILYGPFRFDGVFTAASNAEFDAALRDRNPAWGVRDLSAVTRVAEEAGFVREQVIAMPANNHIVVFRAGSGT
jgi:hypothetical protein